MRRGTTRAGLIAVSAALIGAAACSKTSPTMDSGLKKDLAAAAPSSLELAPQATQAQVTVSAIEAGPESAPKAAAPKKVTRPTTKPAPHVAAPRREVAQAPLPQPKIVTAQAAPTPQPVPQAAPAPAKEPAPLTQPVQARGRQPGVYSTEAQVFAKMPWIRP
jgi:outer membrane biosynthesis protein TonB